jgi:thiol-disulfide isomerase/thioredoxin
MDSTQPKWRFYLFTGIFIFFVGSCLFLTRLDQAVASPSSVSGVASLREMAQQSVPYERALTNGKPTLVEFYADWCTSCQSLAPSISKFHEQYGSQVNFVMLNRPLAKVAAGVLSGVKLCDRSASIIRIAYSNCRES